MDYEKKYKEALERFKTFREKYCTYGELHFGDVIFDKTGEAQKDLDAIFPELRESEDERIRKEIIDYLTLRADVTAFIDEEKDCKRWIAYLEKQKEPIDPFDTKLFQDGVKEGRRLEREDMEKEQKPILGVFGFKVGDAVRLKDGDGRKHIIKSFEGVEGLHGPNFYHVEFEDNSARSGIYTGEEYPNGYYTQMEKFEEEQKPASSGSSEKPNNLLWSEEDEKVWQDIFDLCNRFGYDDACRKLKSLRPHWKPSEVCYGAKGDPDPAGVWKPSEEQPQVADASKMEQEVELEKASRNVYESWMGGTMDDFLRDMVELGKALNARKEE